MRLTVPALKRTDFPWFSYGIENYAEQGESWAEAIDASSKWRHGMRQRLALTGAHQDDPHRSGD